MTRKDYCLIASAFKDEVCEAQDHRTHADRLAALQCVASDLASVLLRDNPRFDCKRFMTACGFRTI
jgi:hypothetical protein